MNYSEKDKDRILSFYNRHIRRFGRESYRALGWNDEADKTPRFAALCAIGDLEGKSVLDVGCGFGDLYAYLHERYENFFYQGIDINPEAVEIARKRYPGVVFQAADFGSYEGPKFDYLLASGTFSFKVEDFKNLYFGHVARMFRFSKIAAGFNMLDARYHSNDETYAAYTIEEMDEFCSTLTDKIEIIENYLPQEFAVFLYH